MPLALLLLTSAFEALPRELEDAARLEGLGLWQCLAECVTFTGSASASTAFWCFCSLE